MELDREDFRLWLAAKDPDEEVGTAGSATSCVLARYLCEHTDDEWAVLPTLMQRPGIYHRRFGSYDSKHVPEWAMHMGIQFDQYALDHGDSANAKQALTILDGIDL